eukprot:CAMPEP_0204180198 /NCGR_PEP_ID=MMETSP0361-20130328/50799_1 /ASSEMBLY_ACC=CAM_ASM_000343 /TAXON_ID=268821 /ORGANISM="Scrippsiella Hangoei, Strain SHTV-5" /LENGTH=70 /DNA_ID=CAMNT_0051139575 /DNA_START=56 /DNA_END=265 /DNA_ORIENTATION=-
MAPEQHPWLVPSPTPSCASQQALFVLQHRTEEAVADDLNSERPELNTWREGGGDKEEEEEAEEEGEENEG